MSYSNRSNLCITKRIIYSIYGSVLFNFGSILLWATTSSIIPTKSVLARTFFAISSSLALLLIGHEYMSFIDYRCKDKSSLDASDEEDEVDDESDIHYQNFNWKSIILFRIFLFRKKYFCLDLYFQIFYLVNKLQMIVEINSKWLLKHSHPRCPEEEKGKEWRDKISIQNDRLLNEKYVSEFHESVFVLMRFFSDEIFVPKTWLSIQSGEP